MITELNLMTLGALFRQVSGYFRISLEVAPEWGSGFGIPVRAGLGFVLCGRLRDDVCLNQGRMWCDFLSA